jgi:putative tricarboxylic transport membrane protein
MSKEKWSSLVWLSLAIFICLGSNGYSIGSLNNPGPGFFPFITGLILGTLALMLHLQFSREVSPRQIEKALLKNRDRTLKMVLTVIALLAYSIGLDYTGFLISTTIFVAFLFWTIEPQRWYIVVFGSAMISVSAYSIFELLLKVPLPKGFSPYF